jgi:hypothetical protein
MYSFIEHVSSRNSTTYFHNLKFDGHFIVDWLLKNGYKHVTTNGRMLRGEFKSLITDDGKWFSMTVTWFNGHTTEFRDSFKKIPLAIRHVATAYGLGETKGDLNYTKNRPVGYIPIAEEIDYLNRDVLIMTKALRVVLASGMTGLTVASDSLKEYKALVGSKWFSRMFPQLSMEADTEIRRALRGGWTYCDPRFSTQFTRSGLVLDVNSLYPSIMKTMLLPYGEPEFVDGKVEPTETHPLVIFSVTFTAKIKPDHVPVIQIKNTSIFAPTAYLSEVAEPTTLMVTNIDWQLYRDHYDVTVLEYGGGWRFHAAYGLFDEYITKWANVKENSKGGLREVAKLHLNSLFGKFGSNPSNISKNPYLDEHGVVKFRTGEEDLAKPVYTAMAVFITSYARNLTIRAAQDNYDVFAYADTDSLHLLTDAIPESLEIHETRMGAWKLEYRFQSAFYVRAKAYLERRHPWSSKTWTDENDGDYVVHIAGVPEHVQNQMTFADCVNQRNITGKLKPKAVPGGVVLVDETYTLKW